MRLPESEKQKITTIVKKITDDFRKEHKIDIRSYYRIDDKLKLIMGDEYVKVGTSYEPEYFEHIAHFIMRRYPGELAEYIGIFWQDQLDDLYSFYSQKLKEKAMEILNSHVSN